MRSPRSPNKARGREFDRHSGTGTRGLPKKNGAGGKGVWGAELDQQPVTYLDKNDPNYDSDAEATGTDAPPTLALTPPSVETAAAPAAAADEKSAPPAESSDSSSAGSSPPTPSLNAASATD